MHHMSPFGEEKARDVPQGEERVVRITIML